MTTTQTDLAALEERLARIEALLQRLLVPLAAAANGVFSGTHAHEVRNAYGDCFGGAIETIPWEQRKPYDEFDYGYVLTVHKSQGSQWDDVVLFDESFAFQDSRARWLYTGITRAAKRLSVVV